MPRNSSGTYALPAGNPVVTNTLIQSTWANTTLSDVSTAMTDSLDRNGRGAMLAPLKNVDGTAVAPAFTFSSEGTLGIYRASAGVLGFAVGGALVLSLASTGLTFTTPLVLPIGSVTAPSLTFAANTNTGLYSPATNQVALTAGGVQGLLLTPALMTVTATAVASGAVALNVVNAQSSQGVSLNVTGTTFSAGGVGASTALLSANAASTNLAIGNLSAGTGIIQFVLNNAERLRIDPAGNVGFGTAASGWGLLKAIEGTAGSLAFNGTTAVYLCQNLYFNGGGWIYKNAGAGSVFISSGGGLQFNSTSSGAAGATATLVQTTSLDAGGNLLLSSGTLSLSASTGQILHNNTTGNITLVASPTLVDNTARIELYDTAHASFARQAIYRGDAHIWTRASAGIGLMTLDANGNLVTVGRVSTGIGAWNSYGYGFTTNAGFAQVSPGSAVPTSAGYWLSVDNSTYRGSAIQMGAAYSFDVYVGNGTGWIKQFSISSAGVIADGAGLELGWKGIPSVSNTFINGQCNIVTASTTINTAAQGNTYAIWNNSAASITLSQGAGLTLRQGGTANTGNRTILPFGYATIWFATASIAVINGNIA